MTDALPQRLPRSPLLMSPDDTAVLVVDMQERLVPAVLNSARTVWNIGRLLRGAAVFQMPVLATEQYPKGLLHTVPELLSHLPARAEKLTFSVGECGSMFRDLADRGVPKILLCGIETHVCVQQSAFDLMALGMEVYLPVDAVSSRFEVDYTTALRRMEASGVTLTTVESALFEWCDVAGTPAFKQISALVKETPPE